jgi:ferredoxin-NADP reductase
MSRLLCSGRAPPEVIYRDELDSCWDGAEVSYTLTRRQPPGWTGFSRRIDAALLKEIAWPAGENPPDFIRGPTSFAEAAAAALVGLGDPPERVKTERSGATEG